MQGDVFLGLRVPGVPLDHDAVMVISHPCSMRHRARLRDRIQVVPVTTYASLPLDAWPDGHYKVFPLPCLDPRNLDLHVAARFDETGMIAASALTASTRAACLSDYGTVALQQRYIHHLTRVVVPTTLLRRQCAHVLEEADLQEEWNVALASVRISDGDDEDSAIDAEAVAFDDFLTTAGLRNQLLNEHERASVRRAIQAEIRHRTTQARVMREADA